MRILLTAFEAYDEWTENSSWLAMVELLRSLPSSIDLVTRRYPVDLDEIQKRLEKDLDQQLDAVLHLGQAPGSSEIRLEAVALNIAGRVEEHGSELSSLTDTGPVAFRSEMPLGRWADALREAHIPAMVSYHAGTFLCNAIMYLTHHWHYTHERNVQVGFMHLPLATEQVARLGRTMPSLPTSTLAQAIGITLQELHAWHEPREQARTNIA